MTTPGFEGGVPALLRGAWLPAGSESAGRSGGVDHPGQRGGVDQREAPLLRQRPFPAGVFTFGRLRLALLAQVRDHICARVCCWVFANGYENSLLFRNPNELLRIPDSITRKTGYCKLKMASRITDQTPIPER